MLFNDLFCLLIFVLFRFHFLYLFKCVRACVCMCEDVCACSGGSQLIQSIFNGSNTFGTIKRCSRQGSST